MRDLSLHLMDILQNSIVAKSDRITVKIFADGITDNLEIEIIDNGEGMDKEFLKQVTDPFVTTRTTRKIGLGIPLLKASAQRANGDLIINSSKMDGTCIKANFKISHIDRLPIGDISETLISTIMGSPEIEYELVINNNKEEFRLNTTEIKNKLDGVSITEFAVLTWIKDFINENVKHILGGVLNEVNS